jgi:rhodanese-related sulfurtransferase
MWDRDCTRKLSVALAALVLGVLAAAACARAAGHELSEAERSRRVTALIEDVERRFPDVPTMDAAEVQRELAAGRIVLVDSRPADERAVSMIPGAIDRNEFERRADELAGATVVTYCTIGQRSSEHARELRRRGWDARNLRGSLLAWTYVGGALVDGDGHPTRRLDVYGPRWDLAADGYETVW